MKNNTSFYSEEELSQLGLGSYGDNVLISRKCSIYSPDKIHIGSHVRIDDFSILSGLVTLGNYIHIAAYCGLYAGGTGITFKDYTNISARSIVFAESDDFNGGCLVNPMVPKDKRKVKYGSVVFEKYATVGAGSMVFPGCVLHEGAAVGAMSLVTKSLEEWGVYVGCPAKRIKDRIKIQDISK